MNRIQNIIIVGGGTAGWIAAAYLNRALGPSVTITLVESSAVGRLGVGEATFPTLRSTLRFIGLDEKEWMPACNATYKLAVRFEGWVGGLGSGDAFYHPFFPRPEPPILPFDSPFFPSFGEGFASAQYWMRRTDRSEPYAYAASPTPALCDARKFGPTAPEDAVVYAYHFDAGLFADYLRDVCIRRGVHHVVAHVGAVEQDDRGFIRRILTEDGRALEGDLFIDCSGFKGLLINEALKEPFDSDARYLLNDRAVAIQVPNDPDNDGLPPYTRSDALSAGWMWRVPLFNRDGSGYVYSSQFTSPDEAEQELRQVLGPVAEGRTARHLRMRIGSCRNLWVKNCVAIGLAGAFLEPLESTSIFFTELQLAWLVALFPDRDFSPVVIRRYNESLGNVYRQLRDFIVLHFCTTQREDTPYWRAVRHEVEVPETLRALLEDYEGGLFPPEAEKFFVFRSSSIACILTGMGLTQKRSSAILDHLPDAAAEAYFNRIARNTERLLRTLPGHFDHVRSLHEQAGA